MINCGWKRVIYGAESCIVLSVSWGSDKQTMKTPSAGTSFVCLNGTPVNIVIIGNFLLHLVIDAGTEEEERER